MSTFVQEYLEEAREVLSRIDGAAVEAVALGLADVRAAGGRVFVLGVGGSAANASHAVNDLRKICGFEAYAPTDNVAELTALINDAGWEGTLATWLEGSRLAARDALFVFSVGGGDRERNVSPNIVRAMDLAKERGARVFGVVGRDGGYCARVADACVIIPTVATERVTPHTEGTCGIVLHLLVSHPALKRSATRWESTR